MKNIIVLSAACAALLVVFAPKTPMLQTSYSVAMANADDQAWKDKYCASIKNGNIIVLNGKSELVVDITLANGSKITTDGYVISKDGTKTALKNGDCVDKNGNIIAAKK